MRDTTEIFSVEGRAVKVTIRRAGELPYLTDLYYEWEVVSTLPGSKWWLLDSGEEHADADAAIVAAGKAAAKAEADALEKGLVV